MFVFHRLRPMFLCLLISLFFCSPALVWSPIATASSGVHLSGQYKFAPTRTAHSTHADSGVVIISSSDYVLKRRPHGYGRVKLSARTLRRKISAKSAVVMDPESGEMMYSHSPDTPGQPASTIKILTGLISIDSLNGHEMVSVSRKAARMPRSKIYLRRGKKYPADDLINAVLLASANDASVALAEKIAGSEKVFAQLMTAKARSFGAKNTVCKTANGLTARGQKTTARDLALIFSNTMRDKEFAQKLSKRKIKCHNGLVVYSHNKALWRINGSVGGKTGYTCAARQTYVGKFERDGDQLIVALLGSETMWSDIKKLVEYGFAKKRQIRQLALKERPSLLPEATQILAFGNRMSQKSLVLSGLQ